MPELPEIETLKNSLKPHLINNHILKFKLNRNNLRYALDHEFQNFVNLQILSMARRGRYLIINLNNNHSLIVHLGMSGSLTLMDSCSVSRKHDHVIMPLKCGQKLVYNDPRRFGMLYLLPSTDLFTHKIFEKFGVEPFDENFNGKYFYEKIKKLKNPIKNILLSNTVVVGVGNIYATESLFMAKIHPSKLGCNITSLEAKKLVEHIKIILKKAINAGGTTLRNFVDGQNKLGYFKQELNIYDKFGQECNFCQAMILNIKLAGRSSYFCPGCQIL